MRTNSRKYLFLVRGKKANKNDKSDTMSERRDNAKSHPTFQCKRTNNYIRYKNISNNISMEKNYNYVRYKTFDVCYKAHACIVRIKSIEIAPLCFVLQK